MNFHDFINLNIIISLQVLSCFFMTGLIWIIQIIHYPAYKFISPSSFFEFELFHTKKISLIVGPIMITEIVTAFFLFIFSTYNFIFILNIFLLLLIWLSTAVFSVPSHNSLLKKLDLTKIDFLIRTNWIRTFLWSLRTLILFFYLIENVKLEYSYV